MNRRLNYKRVILAAAAVLIILFCIGASRSFYGWFSFDPVTDKLTFHKESVFESSVSIGGTVTGKVRVIHETDAAYTLGTDSTADSLGTYFINSDDDAIAYTLDAAASGKCACFENEQGVTGAITVTPGTGDYLVKDGSRGTAATAYTSSGAAGDKLCVVAIGDDDWNITTEVGTWSE